MYTDINIKNIAEFMKNNMGKDWIHIDIEDLESLDNIDEKE